MDGEPIKVVVFKSSDERGGLMGLVQFSYRCRRRPARGATGSATAFEGFPDKFLHKPKPVMRSMPSSLANRQIYSHAEFSGGV